MLSTDTLKRGARLSSICQILLMMRLGSVTARRLASLLSDTFSVEKKKGPTMMHSASSKASDFQMRLASLESAMTLSGFMENRFVPSVLFRYTSGQKRLSTIDRLIRSSCCWVHQRT